MDRTSTLCLTFAACVLLAWVGAEGPSARGQTAPPAATSPAGSPATASAPASAPSASAAAALEASLEWMDPALAPAQSARDRLEHLRRKGGPFAPQVTAAAKEGQDALAAVDRRLADPSLKPPPVPASRMAPRPEEWQAAFRSLVRLRRCQVALLRAELCQAAASALAPGQADRDAYLTAEIDVCRSLRVEYRDMPLAMLGYVFECRAHRLAGNTKASLDALDPILKTAAPAEDRQWAEVLRLAKLERIETLLLLGPAAARDANAWRASAELKNEPQWQARIDWVLARAQVEDMRARQAKGDRPAEADVQRCAGLLRSEALAGAVSPYDRLEALAKLDAVAGGKLMTPPELLAWAELLADAGRDDATAVFERVQAAEGAPMEADQMLAYATLLWKQGRWLRAADVCDRILQRLDPADERGPGVLQARAASLLKAASTQPAAAPGPQTARLLSALQAVFQSSLAEAVRREALLQWVSLGGDRNPAELLDVLARQQDLVQGSAYLLYCQATGAYAALQPRIASAATQPQPDLPKQIEAVLAGLRAAQLAAAEANDAPLLARAILAQAQVISRPPQPDARAALQLLTERRAAIDAAKAVATDAAWLRVQLNLDLGMVDKASDELKDLPEGVIGQAGLPLRLAEALAARQATADEATRGRLRAQIITLCNRAMDQALADSNTFVGVARRCGRTLLSAGAGADAEGILAELLRRPAVQADADANLDCGLLLARAYQAQAKNADAAKQFDGMAARFPKSVAVQEYRGRYQLAMKQPDKAADSFREARKLAKEGSAEWCEATLDLSEALREQGQKAAAADVLRVAFAMHPAFGGVSLRPRLVEAQRQLGLTPVGAEVAR